MGTLNGSIIDKSSGEKVAARVQVLASTGGFTHPADAILKVGTGVPFFYSDGNFSLDVPRGLTQILVERGTEYIPVRSTVEVPSNGTREVDISLEKWNELSEMSWHPGNTHIHYDEKEKRPDDRLSLDPRVEDLRMTAVSILRRWDLEYATNKYHPGMLTEFSSAHHYVECGEENRHNKKGHTITGYGHVMFLNIRNVVEPVSRGMLVDAFDPDYPPLSYACDDARGQGGVVIWCHNGQGMEAPVAAALGKLDAFNLFDPHWMDPEYDIYYQMLNAGLKLPASTGSDWFISSANRVYAYTGGEFNYEEWLSALKAGKTFITNGPALFISVDGFGPGSEVNSKPGDKLNVLVNWKSHHKVTRAELLFNGSVVAQDTIADGSTEGLLESDLNVETDGWIAARLYSNVRDSFDQPIFAHTSPVYVRCGVASPESLVAARSFYEQIEDSLQWVGSKGKFYNDVQRKEILDLFRQGQQVFKDVAESSRLPI